MAASCKMFKVGPIVMIKQGCVYHIVCVDVIEHGFKYKIFIEF